MNGRMTHLLHDVAEIEEWGPQTMVAYFADRENGPLVATIREEIANSELESEIGTIVTMEDDIERGVIYVATETGDAYIAYMSSRSPDAHLVIDDILGDAC